MLAYLNEFHDYFKLYLPNTFLVMFIMFNHSLSRWHSSVGLTILSICKLIIAIIIILSRIVR